MSRRHRTYTVDEATAALETSIRTCVQTIVRLWSALPELHEAEQVANFRTSRPGAGPDIERSYVAARRARHDAELQMARELARLEEADVMLKDASIGLIDFYSIREGELVELCWKLGEDAVRYWHPVNAGYANRQPLT